MKNKRIRVSREAQSNTKTSAALFAFVAFAAITSVLILGYLRFSDTGEAIIELPTATTKENPAKTVIKEGIQAKLPQARDEMFHPLEANIEGKWFSKVGENGIAEITFGGGKFELVYVQTPQDRLRKFSKGDYQYDEITGYLELYPKSGEVPSLQMKGISYKILTMRNFQIIVSKKKDDSVLYFIANERDIPGKNYHPIFLYDDYAGAPVLEFNPVNAAVKSGSSSNKKDK